MRSEDYKGLVQHTRQQEHGRFSRSKLAPTCRFHTSHRLSFAPPSPFSLSFFVWARDLKFLAWFLLCQIRGLFCTQFYDKNVLLFTWRLKFLNILNFFQGSRVLEVRSEAWWALLFFFTFFLLDHCKYTCKYCHYTFESANNLDLHLLNGSCEALRKSAG